MMAKVFTLEEANRILPDLAKVFEKISMRTGKSVEELQQDLILRSKLLYALYKNKVFGFDEVGGIINEYHKNPAEILQRYGIVN